MKVARGVNPEFSPNFYSGPVLLAVISLLLFVLSALVGLWVAYDWTIALQKFLALLLGVVAALGIVALGRMGTRPVMLASLIFVAMVMASNFALVPQLSFPTTSITERYSEPLIIFLPLVSAFVATFWGGATYARRSQPAMLYHIVMPTRGFASRANTTAILEGIALTGLLISAAYLIRSGDMSSGVALLAGIGVATWLILQSRLPTLQHQYVHTLNRALGGGMLIALSLYIWLVASPTTPAMLGNWLPNGLVLRLSHYHEFLALVADYPFTGSGLGVATMVYSTYLFMVQVPFVAQAHNLFLQLAVEQGIPGLIAFVGLLVATLWAMQQLLAAARPEYIAGDRTARMIDAALEQARIHDLAAITVGILVTSIVNGMFDADIYSTSLVALLLVPSATAWGLVVAHHRHRPHMSLTHVMSPLALSGSMLMGLAPLLLTAALFFLSGGAAAIYANAGAIAQTQAELRLYQWPQWPLQDAVRRAHPEALESAKSAFLAAIARNPYNVTAHWRLAQIVLAQGDYRAAEAHLAQAYRVAPHHRVVRQLLGELYATQGNFDQAVQLWQPLDLGQNQLQLRQAWYEMIGDSRRTLNFQEALRIYAQNSCCP